MADILLVVFPASAYYMRLFFNRPFDNSKVPARIPGIQDNTMLVVAESFGALAVVLNFIGYRQNTVEKYLLVSSGALLSVSIHFFMLGAMAAGIGCMLASIRNLVALKYRGKEVLFIFVSANLSFLAYEWFGLDHGWLIFVAYASSLIFTVGSIVLRNATKIRQWFILAELLGLIYAVMVGSIFGTIFNISNLSSILIKLFQEKRQAGQQKPDEV